MATVKGDVHDIGKNIVGVVLQCNGYEVIDLGVMVPWSTILETAKEQDADIIGLSGLITPSLDEMVTVAEEMQRAGFTIPLLIGGATTSKVHTALRIDPAYDGPVIHVLDASRAVGVASQLLSDTQAEPFIKATAAEYEARPRSPRRQGPERAAQPRRCPRQWLRCRHERHGRAARAARPACVRQTGTSPTCAPVSTGRRSSAPGSWRAIIRRSSRTRSSAKARAACLRMRRRCSTRIIGEKWLTAQGVCRVLALRPRTATMSRSTCPRKSATCASPSCASRSKKSRDRANYCLADFISHDGDWIGGFAVGIHGIEPHLARFKAAHDDYNDILLKALADRFAEAFAERLHQHVRTTLWGYAPGEQLTNEALIKEQYRGIRPAPGYPACPDHSLKPILFDLLNAGENAGIVLTESQAMLPTAAVSGFYFAHPQAEYFGVARIGRDQLEDYAARRGIDLAVAERWLRPNLD